MCRLACLVCQILTRTLSFDGLDVLFGLARLSNYSLYFELRRIEIALWTISSAMLRLAF